jgi:hypothetical protein
VTPDELLAAALRLDTARLREHIVTLNTEYARRLAAHRREMWAAQGEAKLDVDSSRERT